MGWDGDEPNNKNDKNRWQKGQPPDLDEALKRFQAKLKKTLNGGKMGTAEPGLPRKGSIFSLFILLIIGVLWFLSGIFIVDPAEQAAILRFGKYIRTVGPGPHWIPRFIDAKTIVNVERVSDYSYSAQMLTKDENLVSVSLAVQYRINDLQAYLFNVADPEESLQQATSSALRQVVGTTTLDEIITEGREAWGMHVQDTLIKILDSYKTGIVILSVSPQPARAPENVQDAFDDAIKAQEDEKRFKEQAFAYKARVVPTAKGNAERILAEAKANAEQVVLKAKGDVAEFLALVPEFVKAPEVTAERMYLDAMQQILSKTTKVVVDDKAGNILYLPLDKITHRMPEEVHAGVVTKAVENTTNNATDPVDNEADNRAANRAVTRPLIRQERNW